MELDSTKHAGIDGKHSEPAGAMWMVCSVAALCLVGSALLWFQSSGTDDAYITYAVAETLAQTGSVLNYSDDAVEQSSSLLHVVVLATAARLTGLSAAVLGWWLAMACAIISVFALPGLDRARRLEVEEPVPREPWVAIAWLGACAYFGYWALGGMETSLAALVLIAWIIAHAQAIARPNHWTVARVGLISLAWFAVRPEAWLISSCSLLAVVVVRVAIERGRPRWPGSSSTLARVVAIDAAAFALLALWRLHTFDSLYPQPVYAKGHASWPAALSSGFDYVLEPASLWPLWIGVGIRTMQLWSRARRGSPTATCEWLIVSTTAAGLGFAVLVGGDWMGGARFLDHVVPIACLGAARAVDTVSRPRLRRAVAIAVALGLWLGGPSLARRRSTGVVAWADIETPQVIDLERYPFSERRNRVHVRDLYLVERLPAILAAIATKKEDRVWLLTGQGGMAAYYSKRALGPRLGVIDRRGLMDRTLTSSAIANAPGKTPWGLTRRYDLVLDRFDAIAEESRMRRPDVIYDLVFDEHEQRSLIAAGYRPVLLQTGWVRSSERDFMGRPLRAVVGVFVHERWIDDGRAIERVAFADTRE